MAYVTAWITNQVLESPLRQKVFSDFLYAGTMGQPEIPQQLVQPASGRPWLVVLGTAALCSFDPLLLEFADLAVAVATAGTQGVAKADVNQLRAKARDLNRKLAPMAARALSRVVRRAERACGSVVDKRARVAELQASWDDLLTCLQRIQR